MAIPNSGTNGGGSAVSFTKTPQAKDDAYASLGLTEDSASVFLLDVLANDLGGNAKKLYSLDSGDNVNDLLAKDGASSQALTADRSALGARIWITADGKIGYDASTLSGVQQLGAGESAEDSFVYAIQLGNGTLSWAKVTLVVAGVNDAVAIVSAVDAGSVLEADDNSPGENAITHSATGTIGFGDVDSRDTHSVSFTPNAGGYRGTFSAALADDSTGDGSGSVTWDFAVADADLDDLAWGETLAQDYTVVVDDGHGGSASQRVTITITGTNDAPVITSGGGEAIFSEIPDLDPGENSTQHSAAGTIEFADVDLRDTHNVSYAPQNGGYRGAFSAVLADDSTGDGSGSVRWDFAVADAELDDLAQGESLIQQYVVSIGEHHGGSTGASQVVTITITGTNDAPVIGAAVDAGSAAEIADLAPGENATTHSAAGTIEFADVDLRDTHGVSYAPQNGGYRGAFSAALAEDSTGDGSGAVSWNFEVADADLDDLANGETLTQTYGVTLEDGQGGSATQTVTVTITGTNDAPVIGAAVDAGSATEVADLAAGENATTHSAAGSISFADVDLRDTHSVSFIPEVRGYRGRFSAALADDSTGDGAGAVRWNFEVADADLDDLARGETLTQRYAVTVNDAQGGSASEVVTITITGTNDAPVITSGLSAGEVSEAANNSPDEANNVIHQAAGTLAFTDVDLADAHSVSVTGNTTLGYRGSLAAVVNDPSTGDGAGSVQWTFSVPDSALDDLVSGQTLTQTYTVTVNDGHGGTSSQQVSITLNGADDNPPPVAVDDSVLTDEDVPVTFNVVSNDTDADAGQTLSAVNVSGLSDPLLGTLQDLGGGQFQFTPAADASGTASFTYQAFDGEANSGNAATVNITVSPVNDAPAITGGTASGTVYEDGPRPASGQLIANDVDQGAVLHWSVDEPLTTRVDYRFVADSLHITKNGGAFFDDDFGNNVPPPQAPNFAGGNPTSYSTSGVFLEEGGRLIMDSSLAGPALSVGTADRFVGHFATLLSNNISTDTTLGLKINHSFTVEGRFDLVLPDELREGYGVRLSDRFTPASAPQNPGDDTVEAVVRRGTDGVVAVQLRDVNFAANTVTNLGSVALNMQPGEDQIVLRLSHDTPNTDVVRASFDVFAGSTLTRSVTIGPVGHIFGTDTPTTTADDENWTRASIVAYAPAPVLNGTYGALSVDNGGHWTYALNNGAANVQALAQGETATDTFTVRVTDEHSASDTQTVTVNVVGTDDAPVITGGPNFGFVTEDSSAPTATGRLTASDIDHGASLNWSVSRSPTGYASDYRFALDDLTITRNSVEFFHDGFDDGVAPPSAPNSFADGTPASYQPNGARFTEQGGNLILDGSAAGTTLGVGNNNLVAAHTLLLNSNIDPSDLSRGLKIGDDFTVEARFDTNDDFRLTNPQQGVGILLSDRTVGGALPDQLGDDLVFLRIVRDDSGTFSVQLRQLDVVTDTATVLGSVVAGHEGEELNIDHVVLRLTHEAANPGTVHGSFELLEGSAVVRSGQISEVGHIFGTGTPNDPSDDENWTRLSVIAVGNDEGGGSALQGTYGSLSVDANGQWTYALNSGAANVQALAQGQFATDQFSVRVTDEFGLSSQRPIFINVNGTNDAPVITDATAIGGVEEDGTLMASGAIAFSDVDLRDGHSVSFTPAPGNSTALGNFNLSPVIEAPNAADGSLTWHYGLDNALAQYLTQGQVVTETYAVTVRDDFGATATQDVTIRITGTNDAPETNSTSASGNEDAATIAVTLTGSDIDGTLASFRIASLPANGTLYSDAAYTQVIALNGSVTASGNAATVYFKPNADWNGSTSFQYAAVDNNGAADATPATASITVAAVNDAPVLSVPGGAAGWNFTTIDYPGSPYTIAIDINNLGQIVGQAAVPGHGIGWEYSGGAFTPIAISGATNTSTNAINDLGVVGGYYEPGSSTPRYGFIENGGVFTTGISLSPHISTTVFGINDAGVYVGSSYLNGDNFYAGFINNGGSITILDAPGATYTSPNGINDAGQVVGTYAPTSSSGWLGFVYENGVYATVAAPLGANGTFAVGINDGAQVVGWYTDSAGRDHGFLEDGGIVTTIDNPLGTNATMVQGINDVGQIVGRYIDGSGISHGFVASHSGNSTAEDTPLAIAGVSVSDVDAGSDALSMTLTVGHGALTLAGTAGLSNVAGAGTGTLTFEGSQAAINAALAGGLTYTPSANYNGSDTLAVSANDQGHNGTGGALSSTQSIALAINAVNDAPLAALVAAPASVGVGQPVALDASASRDPDAGDTLSYAWDLDDDGQFDDATGVNASTSFTIAGIHIVRVQVTDSGGLSAQAAVAVNAVNNAPVALNDSLVGSGGAASLVSQTLWGGSGDQRFHDVDFGFGRLWLGAEANIGINQSYAVAFDEQNLVSPSLVRLWSQSGNSEAFFDVAVSPSAPQAVFAGMSYGTTFDGVGGKEAKADLLSIDPGGGIRWFRQADVNGNDAMYSYTGTEAFNSIVASVEGGNTYYYAAGGGEPYSYFAMAVMKIDVNGNRVTQAPDPSLGTFSPGFFSTGSSQAYDVMVAGGKAYVAGYTGWNAQGDPSGRPALWTFGTDLRHQASYKDSTLFGTFNGMATLNGEIYAVGQRNNSSNTGADYLIEKFDQNGNFLWRSISGTSGEDSLQDVVVLGNRLFATGYTNGEGAGRYDAVLAEIDPATGALLSKTLFGGANDDKGWGLTTDGTNLFVAGESRSFTVGGNGAGQNDGLLLKYTPGQGFLEDMPITITPASLLANDSDVDGDTLSISSVSGAVNGSVALSGGNVVFTPSANYFGPASFTYTASDGHGGTASATVSLNVVSVNDAPVIGGQTSGSVTEDSITSTGGTLTINDPDAGESSFQAQSGLAGAYGTLNINAAGNWTYFLNNSLPAVQALNTGQSLADSVTVRAADGTTQAIGITINGTNEPNSNDVGYYSMVSGQGLAAQVDEISLAMYNAVNITIPNASQITGLAALYVNNESNSGFASEFTSNLAPIWNAVANGMTLIIHDRAVTNATSILPGIGSGFTILRDLNNDSSSANLNADAGSKIATGPGGTVNNASLDGGNLTSHGYIDVFNTMPASAEIFLNRDANANLVITIGYEYGNGYVIYSTIPLDLFTGSNHSGITNAEANTYAANVIAYGAGRARGTISPNDPIVLDLNGDGVHFATGEGAFAFDLDADGTAEQIAWASPQDGVLVMDLNGTGAIEDGTEVLSEHFNGFGFGTSMEALRSLDTNVDGTVDAEDAQFADVQVWRDGNSDGVSQAGEVLSLGDLGIVGISVHEEARDETIDGQHVYAAGTFIYDTGATGDYVGVHLTPPSLADAEGGEAASGDPASGSDRFDFNSINDAGETIADFTTGTGGDVLDIRDLLTGYSPGTSNINDFVQLAESGGSTTVSVDSNGAVGGESYTALTTLQGVTGLSLSSLLNDGNLIVT